MRMLSAILVALFAFFFKVVRCGDSAHNVPWAKRHSRVALSDGAGVTRQNFTNVEKRFDGARFTFFTTGLGACGTTNTASDFIVALNAPQYDGGSYCYQFVTITVNGKTAQAQITDRCAACPYGGLDFTSGLFQFFASEGAGVLTGSWDFVGASTPTPTPTPTPTSTYEPPPHTSVVTPTSSLHTSTSASSSVSSSQAQPTSSTTSSSLTPTPTPLIPLPAIGNIADLFVVYIEMSLISTVGHGLN